MTHATPSDCSDLRDELSAWLDGECADSRRVEEHLAHCAECAEHVRQMSVISQTIRQLPVHDADHLFAARVAAQLRPSRRPVPARRYWPVASAVMAAAAGIVIVVAAVLSQREPAPVQKMHVGLKPAAVQEENLADALLVETGDGADAGLAAFVDEPAGYSSDDLVLALSTSGWFEDAAREYESEIDIYDLVQSLNDTQKSELIRLLRAYTNREDAQI